MNKVQLIVLQGLTDYEDAHQLQLEKVEQRKSGTILDTLILLEHPPVITLGKNADTAGVTAPQTLLSQENISVHRIERGGQATYHGPGQIVGYPIVNLHELRIGAAEYVRRLEEVMIISARRLGVKSRRLEKVTGVFSDKGKIGAIGVRVSRGITYHGFAFNIDPNLSHYQLIVPCGMIDTPVTSLGSLGGCTDLAEGKQAIADAFAQVFNCEFVSPEFE